MSNRHSRSINIQLGLILGCTALVFLAWSCDTTSDTPEEEDPVVEVSGADVWNQLQSEDYQNNWEFWPGTDVLYDGGTAHMDPFLMTTYVNDIAYQAVMDGVRSLPDGSIIVKETYVPQDSTFEAVTTMVKVEGYNSDHNDWFWLMTSPDGMIGAEGRVDMCQSCHVQASASDYIFQEFPE